MEPAKELPILELDKDDIRRALSRIKEGYRGFYGPCTTNNIGCLLAAKTPNKGEDSGWVKCKVNGKKEFYIHHLALIQAGRTEELKMIAYGEYQVSHLCHHRNCFNPDHLVVESGQNNRDRNKCRGWTWLICPCGCKHQFNPCPHNPKCILPTQLEQ